MSAALRRSLRRSRGWSGRRVTLGRCGDEGLEMGAEGSVAAEDEVDARVGVLPPGAKVSASGARSSSPCLAPMLPE